MAQQHHPKAYDLVVLGAGSGGLAAAKRAASHGARVAVVEADRVGGTCVIRGCIPKKLMVYASQLGAARALASDFGWQAAKPQFNWQHLCRIRDQVVNNLELTHQQHLAAAGVQCWAARGELSGPHTLRLQAVAHSPAELPPTLQAKHILIATGAAPVLPDLPGVQHCLTSREFFTLAALPATAILVGGGYIAVEFASLLAGLGCQTTLVVRRRLLSSFDDDLTASLLQALRQRGVQVLEHTQVEAIKLLSDAPTTAALQPIALQVRTHQADATAVQPTTQTLHSDSCVLFATGRRPISRGLGLEALGVQWSDSVPEALQVDATFHTNIPSIAAVGDVTGQRHLTPMAIRAGRAYADHLFKKTSTAPPVPAAVHTDLVPTAVFCEPPLATVGLTEHQAAQRYGSAAVQIFKTRFIPLRYAASPPGRKIAAVVKVIVHKADDKVLGIHILGDDAPEIIQGFAVAMTAGLRKAHLDQTCALHPSLAEELVLLR